MASHMVQRVWEHTTCVRDQMNGLVDRAYDRLVEGGFVERAWARGETAHGGRACGESMGSWRVHMSESGGCIKKPHHIIERQHQVITSRDDLETIEHPHLLQTVSRHQAPRRP